MNYLTKKRLRVKGLNFNLPQNYLDHADFVVYFESLC